MPETPAFSWRTIAAVSLLPIVLIGVLLALVLRGKGASSVETLGTSSASSESSASSTISSTSSTSSPATVVSSSVAVTASSTPSVAFTGPIAPFDGCLGTVKYYDQPWFAGARASAEREGVYLDDFGSIPEACLSTDYLIAIYRVEFGKSTVGRYDRATKTYAKATLEGTAAAPVANAFGKRAGDIIPLLLDGCSSGTYDVRRNAVTGNGERCETRYCSMTPIPTAIGYDIWPVSPKYAAFGELGRLFTAGDCGEARVKQHYPTGTYAWGVRLRLKTTPTTGLENALRAADFQCVDDGCVTWEQSATSIPVSRLLPLRAYVNEMSGNECIHCG